MAPKVVLGNRQNEVGQLLNQFKNFRKIEARCYKCRVLALKSDKTHLSTLICAKFIGWLAPFYRKKNTPPLKGKLFLSQT